MLVAEQGMTIAKVIQSGLFNQIPEFMGECAGMTRQKAVPECGINVPDAVENLNFSGDGMSQEEPVNMSRKWGSF